MPLYVAIERHALSSMEALDNHIDQNAAKLTSILCSLTGIERFPVSDRVVLFLASAVLLCATGLLWQSINSAIVEIWLQSGNEATLVRGRTAGTVVLLANEPALRLHGQLRPKYCARTFLVSQNSPFYQSYLNQTGHS